MYNDNELSRRNENIGRQIRQLRRSCGMAQQEAADQLGISYQQFQKYETGQNRISAASLELLAEVFKVPVDRFFIKPSPLDYSLDKVSMRLIRLYESIRNDKLQRHLLASAEIFAEIDNA